MEWLNKYKKETNVKKATLDSLRKFFGGDIEFRISSKIREEIKELFNEVQYNFEKKNNDLQIAKAELEKLITKSKAELKKAKKEFNRGEINRDTLFDYEYRLIELRNQLDEVIAKLKG